MYRHSLYYCITGFKRIPSEKKRLLLELIACPASGKTILLINFCSKKHTQRKSTNRNPLAASPPFPQNDAKTLRNRPDVFVRDFRPLSSHAQRSNSVGLLPWAFVSPGVSKQSGGGGFNCESSGERVAIVLT